MENKTLKPASCRADGVQVSSRNHSPLKRSQPEDESQSTLSAPSASTPGPAGVRTRATTRTRRQPPSSTASPNRKLHLLETEVRWSPSKIFEKTNEDLSESKKTKDEASPQRASAKSVKTKRLISRQALRSKIASMKFATTSAEKTSPENRYSPEHYHPNYTRTSNVSSTLGLVASRRSKSTGLKRLMPPVSMTKGIYRRYQCPEREMELCEFDTPVIGFLLQHVKDKHPNCGQHLCYDCIKIFPTLEHLNRHQSKQRKDLRCQTCERQFCTTRDMNEHSQVIGCRALMCKTRSIVYNCLKD